MRDSSEPSKPKRTRVNYAKLSEEQREAHRAKKRAAYAAKARQVRAARHPDDRTSIHFAASLKARYGLTPTVFEAMWEFQGGRCDLCRAALVRARAGYAVDHDHQTGAVRSLLCMRCNMTVGVFEKNRARLPLFAEYVDRHRRDVDGTGPRE